MNWYKKAIQFDHVYLPVSNLKDAIEFYQKLLNQKVTHVEEDRWADFHENKPFIGLKNKKYLDNPSPQNSIVLWTNNIKQEYKRIKEFAEIQEPLRQDKNIDFKYMFFKIKDNDKNVITICNYKD